MKNYSIAIIILILLLTGCSVKNLQKDNSTDKDPNAEMIFVVVEDMPTFRGGDINDFRDWVQERVQYPKKAVKERIEGKVFVMFVIEPDGSVSETRIMRGVHPDLDKETLRVVNESPKWRPGLQNDVPVSVRFSITIEYILI